MLVRRAGVADETADPGRGGTGGRDLIDGSIRPRDDEETGIRVDEAASRDGDGASPILAMDDVDAERMPLPDGLTGSGRRLGVGCFSWATLTMAATCTSATSSSIATSPAFTSSTSSLPTSSISSAPLLPSPQLGASNLNGSSATLAIVLVEVAWACDDSGAEKGGLELNSGLRWMCIVGMRFDLPT